MNQANEYDPAVLDTEKIKSLRERVGLSQDAAAKAAGYSGRQWWHNIESGQQTNIELATLNRIAKVLNTKAKSLLK